MYLWIFDGRFWAKGQACGWQYKYSFSVLPLQVKTVRHAAGFGCTESIKRVDQIDPAVWRWVVDLISNDERLEQLIGEIAAESAEKDRTG